MNFIVLLPIIFAFILTFFLLPSWMKKARTINLVWVDMNKLHSDKVPGSGGSMVLLGFVVASFIYIALLVFLNHETAQLAQLVALILVVVFAGFIGFIDDLLGWQHGGLSKVPRLLLVACAAIPLIAINAGKSVLSLPYFGQIDVGIFYPLVLIPLGVIGATTTYNFLAGYNGLEAGQGIILLSALALVAYLTASPSLVVISLCMVAALLAFLIFNIYPARVFPGDVLTYPIGALIACIAILGNFEKIAVFFFIPYILETILKSRGKLMKYSFGKPQKDGSLALPYEKIYGLEHLSILLLQKLNIKPTEKRVVFSLWLFQLFIVLVGFLLFWKGIVQ